MLLINWWHDVTPDCTVGLMRTTAMWRFPGRYIRESSPVVRRGTVRNAPISLFLASRFLSIKYWYCHIGVLHSEMKEVNRLFISISVNVQHYLYNTSITDRQPPVSQWYSTFYFQPPRIFKIFQSLSLSTHGTKNIVGTSHSDSTWSDFQPGNLAAWVYSATNSSGTALYCSFITRTLIVYNLKCDTFAVGVASSVYLVMLYVCYYSCTTL